MPTEVGIDVEIEIKNVVDKLNRIKKELKKVEAVGQKSIGGGIDKPFKSAEKALESARRQVASFVASTRKIATDTKPTTISVAAAFKDLSKVLKQDKVSADRARDAIDKFKTALNSGRISAAQMRKKVAAAKKATDSLSVSQNRSTKSTKRQASAFTKSATAIAAFQGPLGPLAGRIRSFGDAVRQSGRLVVGLASAFIGLGIAAKASISATMKFDRIRSTLSAVFGGMESAGVQMMFVKKVARTYGLELSSLAKNYAQLSAASKGTSLQGRATKDIFKALSVTSRALKLPAGDVDRAMKAVSQMMSKGTVTAEELKEQLGDALPGALNLAAKAMGKNTKELLKMMKNGELLVVDLLPKLSKVLTDTYGGAALESAEELDSNINRLRTSFQILGDNIGKSLTPVVNNFVSSVNVAIEGINGLMFGNRTLNKSVIQLEENLFGLKKALVEIGVAIATYFAVTKWAAIGTAIAAVGRSVVALRVAIAALRSGIISLNLVMSKTVFGAIAAGAVYTAEQFGLLDSVMEGFLDKPETIAGKLSKLQQTFEDMTAPQLQATINDIEDLIDVLKAGKTQFTEMGSKTIVSQEALDNIMNAEYLLLLLQKRLKILSQKAKDAMEDVGDPFENLLKSINMLNPNYKKAIELSKQFSDFQKKINDLVKEYNLSAEQEKALNDALAFSFKLLGNEGKKSAKEVKSEWEKAAESMRSSMESTITDAIMGFKSLGDAVKDLGNLIAREIIQRKISEPLVEGLLGDGGFISGLFNGGSKTAVSNTTIGGGFSRAGTSHSGGIVGKDTPKFHNGGIVDGLGSKEVPAILEKGEMVLTKEQQKAVGNNVVNVTYSPQVMAFDARSASSAIKAHAGEILQIVEQAMNTRGRRGPLSA